MLAKELKTTECSQLAETTHHMHINCPFIDLQCKSPNSPTWIHTSLWCWLCLWWCCCHWQTNWTKPLLCMFQCWNIHSSALADLFYEHEASDWGSKSLFFKYYYTSTETVNEKGSIIPKYTGDSERLWCSSSWSFLSIYTIWRSHIWLRCNKKVSNFANFPWYFNVYYLSWDYTSINQLIPGYSPTDIQFFK